MQFFEEAVKNAVAKAEEQAKKDSLRIIEDIKPYQYKLIRPADFAGVMAESVENEGLVTGTLEEWPTASWEGEPEEEGEQQPPIRFEDGKDLQNRMEIDRANGIISALRERSRIKGRQNEQLSYKLDALQKTGKEFHAMLEEKEKHIDQLHQNEIQLNTELARSNRIIDFLLSKDGF